MAVIEKVKHYTRSNVQCSAWSEDDVQRLVMAYDSFGCNWKQICKVCFPSRTPN